MNRPNPIVQSLIRQLGSWNLETRTSATDALVRMGGYAVPTLCQALHHQEQEVRAGAVEALGKIGGSEAIRALLETLDRGDPILITRATEALARYGKPTLEPLLAAMQEGSLDMRVHALAVLGRIDLPEALPPLLVAIEDAEFDIRRASIRALEHKQGDAVITALCKALGDKGSGIRVRAAEVLCHRAEKQALPYLLKSLKDENTEVRAYSAEALGYFETNEVLTPLTEALKESEMEVRSAVVKSLCRLDPAQTNEVLCVVINRDTSLIVREIVAEFWVTHAEPAVIPTLIGALEDDSPSMRGRSAVTLGRLRATQAVPALVLALKKIQTEAYVQSDIVEALAKIGTPAIPEICSALSDPSLEIRRRLLWALDVIDTPSVLPQRVLANKNLTTEQKYKTLVVLSQIRKGIGNAYPIGDVEKYCETIAYDETADRFLRTGAEEVIHAFTYLRASTAPDQADTLLRPAAEVIDTKARKELLRASEPVPETSPQKSLRSRLQRFFGRTD